MLLYNGEIFHTKSAPVGSLTQTLTPESNDGLALFELFEHKSLTTAKSNNFVQEMVDLLVE